MKKNSLVGWFALALLLPLAGFGIMRIKTSFLDKLPYYGENFTECAKRDAKKVESFHFTNQDGKEVDNAFTSGRVWVACYFFTRCPSICPRMIAGMGGVQARFRNDDRLRMVSFTVDPGHDRPTVLHEYAAERSIDTRYWNFLTGAKEDLYRYARKELKVDASEGDGGVDDFIHSDRLVLVDRENYIRGYYDGTEPTEVKQLIRDIEKLIK